MKLPLALALICAFIPTIALAQSRLPPVSDSPPTPDSNGDYARNTYQGSWIVTDPDPDGVNCRWSTEMPDNWGDPGAVFPRMNIQQWPVVRRFPPGTLLAANIEPVGITTLRDEEGNNWLKVIIPNINRDPHQICLVRANVNFVRPAP